MLAINICFRRRTIVAIGTHDLDTLHGPFTYEALPPSSINFVPLKQSDLKLEKFLRIIENSPVFPVLYDSTRTVLSLPPIINGAHSAIKLETKNVFIECTATDLSKAKIVLNVMAKMLSEYCERKFEIEPVEVIYCDGKSYIYPDLFVYNMGVSLSNITGAIGVPLEVDESLNPPLLSKAVEVAQPPSHNPNHTHEFRLHACQVVHMLEALAQRKVDAQTKRVEESNTKLAQVMSLVTAKFVEMEAMKKQHAQKE
nr:phenylalanine--trna ligase beta subunit, cytoplasmic [Quercus suber]